MTDRKLIQRTGDCLLTGVCAAEGHRIQKVQPEPDYSKAGFGKPQSEEGCAGCGKQASEGWALYCVKCNERKWVGLTDEEIKRWKPVCADFESFRAGIRAIEAKLKEKNG